jgi:hypothetical protein
MGPPTIEVPVVDVHTNSTSDSYKDVLNRNASEINDLSGIDESLGVSGAPLPGSVYAVTNDTDPLSSYRNVCEKCEDTIIRTNHNNPEFSSHTSPGLNPYSDNSLPFKHVCNTQSISNTCKVTKY